MKNKHMILTCVHVHVKPEKITDFIRATEKNHFGTRKEPGNIRFDLLQEENDPTRFMLYEVFESEEAVKAHKETAHYQAWRDSVADFMAGDRKGIRYRIIQPEGRSKW